MLMAPNSIISLSQRSSMTCEKWRRSRFYCQPACGNVATCNTHQSTEQIVIGASAQSQIAHMLYQYLLGHFRGTIEHDVLLAEATDLLQCVQKLDGLADVRDAFDQLHLKGFVAGLEALVDLLQA